MATYSGRPAGVPPTPNFAAALPMVAEAATTAFLFVATLNANLQSATHTGTSRVREGNVREQGVVGGGHRHARDATTAARALQSPVAFCSPSLESRRQPRARLPGAARAKNPSGL